MISLVMKTLSYDVQREIHCSIFRAEKKKGTIETTKRHLGTPNQICLKERSNERKET